MSMTLATRIKILTAEDGSQQFIPEYQSRLFFFHVWRSFADPQHGGELSYSTLKGAQETNDFVLSQELRDAAKKTKFVSYINHP